MPPSGLCLRYERGGSGADGAAADGLCGHSIAAVLPGVCVAAFAGCCGVAAAPSGTAAARGTASNGTAGAAHQCASLFLPFAQRGHPVADRLRPHPLRGSRSGCPCMVRRAGWAVPRTGGGMAVAGTDIPDDLGVGGMKKRGLIICGATLGLLCSKTALKAAAAEATPWQTYLDKAPVQAEQFAADPLGTLVRLFAAEPVQLLRDTMQQYADVLLFLSLAAGLAFLLQDTADRALLELAAAGGCGVLLWQELDKLAAALCTRMAGWKSYLLGFLPVYSGVLAAGGEWNAGAAANGFLLTVLCFIAQAVTLWLQPLLRSYLAISMACGISSRKSLSEGCTLTGRLLRQAIGWAGKAFAALMSIQRVVMVQLDRSASRLGQLLTGSVPIVGQALSNAADAVLAGMQLLKSTLGIAALLSIGTY